MADAVNRIVYPLLVGVVPRAPARSARANGRPAFDSCIALATERATSSVYIG